MVDSYKIDITVDRDIFDAIGNVSRTMPTLMNVAYKRAVSRLRSKLLTRLDVQPGPVKYPIRWKSARQRRAFFATNGFGRGIPTRRSGKLGKSWKIDLLEEQDGGIFTVYNITNYEQYVTGIDQQPFHMDTGWYHSQDILAEALVEAEEVLIQTWFTVADGVV